MTEPDDLQREILEIESAESQKIKRNIQVESFELIPYKWLLAYLAGNSGALFVRAVLHELHINEHHIFKWRLEHKPPHTKYLIINDLNSNLYMRHTTIQLDNFIYTFQNLNGKAES